MKIKFLATSKAPDSYSFDGESVTAYYAGISEEFDLSAVEEGDKFEGCQIDELPLDSNLVIRNVWRDSDGLCVLLCQSSPPGHWRESAWINASQYSPHKRYVRQVFV